MANEEKYRTPAERSAAFDRYCNKRRRKIACYFRWLHDTEKPPKFKIITNAEYYQSTCDRTKAFKEYCSLHRCETCDLENYRFRWLDLIHSTEKKELK